MESYMDDLNTRIAPLLKTYPNLQVTKSVVPGSAVEALTQASKTHDVVVVGSRGRGGFTGLLLGSTSQGLLQHAVSPVYVVPRKYVEAEESGLKAAAEGGLIVETKDIDQITGVEQVSVDTAKPEQLADIESTIDPERRK